MDLNSNSNKSHSYHTTNFFPYIIAIIFIMQLILVNFVMSYVLPVELETLDISVLQRCFGRPILNSGLILLQWKLMLTYRAGYTHDAVLWFTFRRLVKLYFCLFCSLNIHKYHLSGNSGTFSFKT